MRSFMARSHGEDGFTLIELMVVVLIIAILLAIAIPTFLGAREKAQNRAAQSGLRNALAAEKIHRWRGLLHRRHGAPGRRAQPAMGDGSGSGNRGVAAHWRDRCRLPDQEVGHRHLLFDGRDGEERHRVRHRRSEHHLPDDRAGQLHHGRLVGHSGGDSSVHSRPSPPRVNGCCGPADCWAVMAGACWSANPNASLIDTTPSWLLSAIRCSMA